MEIHFRSNFSGHLRSMYTQLNFVGIFFDKMDAVGHFGCPKFTFDRISGHISFEFEECTLNPSKVIVVTTKL